MVWTTRRQEDARFGAAFRDRVAAQADKELAMGPENPLRQAMLNESPSRAERHRQIEEAVKLLLERPPAPASEDSDAQHDPGIDLAALRRAAEAGDLKALASMDRRLQKLLDADARLQLLEDSDFQEPSVKGALRLYCDSLISLDGECQQREREAFAAVSRDDAEALKDLLSKGVNKNARNKGGHTLLQLARERRRVACEQALIEAGVKR
eukprot:TRINITY_DN762_c0_g3_i1.p1 TRINITY_DN762_c0_g3~~TRINITY_DN762_c0_g3_i1.p1  ORF type:complete len:210 (+),score=66.73 TRINITY_DN762_c0_g3_i1:84-713(+)